MEETCQCKKCTLKSVRKLSDNNVLQFSTDFRLKNMKKYERASKNFLNFNFPTDIINNVFVCLGR